MLTCGIGVSLRASHSPTLPVRLKPKQLEYSDNLFSPIVFVVKKQRKKPTKTVSVWSDSFYLARCTMSLLSAPSDSKMVTWIHCDV